MPEALRTVLPQEQARAEVANNGKPAGVRVLDEGKY